MTIGKSSRYVPGFSQILHIDFQSHVLFEQSLNLRTKFHQTGGFDRLSSYLDHAFMMGWELNKERAMDELQADMYSTADTYETFMLRVSILQISDTTGGQMYV